MLFMTRRLYVNLPPSEKEDIVQKYAYIGWSSQYKSEFFPADEKYLFFFVDYHEMITWAEEQKDSNKDHQVWKLYESSMYPLIEGTEYISWPISSWLEMNEEEKEIFSKIYKWVIYKIGQDCDGQRPSNRFVLLSECEPDLNDFAESDMDSDGITHTYLDLESYINEIGLNL